MYNLHVTGTLGFRLTFSLLHIKWEKIIIHPITQGDSPRFPLYWVQIERVRVSSLNCARFLTTPWTVAHQAPLSRGFSRQEYWGGLPCPPPGDLSNPGIETASLASPVLQVNSFPLRHLGSLVLTEQAWITYPSPKPNTIP